jgi:hypothetical protein
MSPLAILDGISAAKGLVEGGAPSFASTFLCKQIAPIYLMVFNYILIPLMVNQATKLIAF